MSVRDLIVRVDGLWVCVLDGASFGSFRKAFHYVMVKYGSGGLGEKKV